jgi:hypothetical protein
MIENIRKKLQPGEAVGLGVQLCVNCPMHNMYVPVKGYCYNVNVSEDGVGVRLLGKDPFSYDLGQKCPHVLTGVMRPSSRYLTDVVCGYKADSE